MDVIFLPGARKREDLEAIREAISLPLIASGLPDFENGKNGLQILQEIGFRMTLLATFPFQVAIQAMHDCVAFLKAHGEPGPYAERICSPRMLEEILRAKTYDDLRKQFMQDENG